MVDSAVASLVLIKWHPGEQNQAVAAVFGVSAAKSCDCYVPVHDAFQAREASRAPNLKNFIENEAVSLYHSIEPRVTRLLAPRTHHRLADWDWGFRQPENIEITRAGGTPTCKPPPSERLGPVRFCASLTPFPVPRRAPTHAPISSGQSGLHFPGISSRCPAPGSLVRLAQCPNTRSNTVQYGPAACSHGLHAFSASSPSAQD